jgi:hypothetical protein
MRRWRISGRPDHGDAAFRDMCEERAEAEKTIAATDLAPPGMRDARRDKSALGDRDFDAGNRTGREPVV